MYDRFKKLRSFLFLRYGVAVLLWVVLALTTYASALPSIHYLPRDTTSQLGPNTTSITWHAGHSAVMINNWMVLYGGVTSTAGWMDASGTTDILVWDYNTAMWYTPQTKVEAGALPMFGQKFAPAVNLPANGKLLVLASNTTNGGETGAVQVLDTNFWNWLEPPTSK